MNHLPRNLSLHVFSRCIVSLCSLLAWAAAAHAQSGVCAALTMRHFSGARILSARLNAAGAFKLSASGPFVPGTVQLPAFCRVRGTAAPRIGFELWMPVSWNGRLVATGSGGFGGTIDEDALASLLAKGYAATANDTGHTGQSYAWMHDRTARRAWGHSATHDVVGPVNAILRAYYRRRPAYSYFQGCSTGGAQAMEEAEFFPSDFAGIVASSPGMYYSHLMLSFLWGLKSASDHAVLSEQKLLLLHRAALKACDAADGLKDGLIANPPACRFNPATLTCKGADTSDCLTPEEMKTAQLIYRGPRDSRTGAQIYPGFAVGSEASAEYTGPLGVVFGWRVIQGPLALQYAIPLLKNMVFGEDWDWKTFDFDRDVARVDRAVHRDIDSVDPDLRAFEARHGKLIMTQGWGDPYNAPSLPIEYRDRVIALFAGSNDAQAARRQVDSFFRLFMAPGMGHCAGGPGPSEIDALDAVEAWVEDGKAPDRLLARKISLPGGRPSSPPMTRPLCPYPRLARWTGMGSTSDAANFVCVEGGSPNLR